MKDSIENVGYSKEKAVTTLAELFGAGFSSAIQEALQNKTTTTCSRVEKTSLSETLAGADAPLSAVGFRFQEGLRGSGLVLVRQEDLIRIAGQLLQEPAETEMDPEAAWKEWEPVFGRAMELTRERVEAQAGVDVKSDAPVLTAPEANSESLSEHISSFENVVSMTFELAMEDGTESRFWLLAHPDILSTFEALLLKNEETPEELSDEGVQANWNMDLILDVELGVTVVYGNTEMPLKDVLKLGVGSVVELEKGVNDPVTIIVNDKPIAQGEVVMVDGNYGVRILDVESTAERIRSLG